MFSFRKPSPEAIRGFLAEQQKCDFTYPAIGGTEWTPPAGFVIDHTRVKLGDGEKIFNEAKAILTRWGIFSLAGLSPVPAIFRSSRGKLSAC